ncbi:amidohydrolase [Thermaurantimonas aggregans]|uniref:Amidohydrolase n=1 Tax=Thermaurantimonas aggregans TaxID=2173829 RepID=A0A401XI68_9FLAO|nr:amidohydrolase family protein [Thermaurantimonas aggregans]MCX8149313.1 amidohydrolase family protein [Thermaurantimonas aggregans]GCD76710.1 amidohydrolase [Thermaurantimonas aggregans]
MKTNKLILLAIAIIHQTVFAQKALHCLTNARIYAENGVIENGFITFQNGIIQQIGSMAEWKNPGTDAVVVDVKGQNVYPGFIALDSRVGLTEIDAVRATRDFNEVGQFNPHVRTLIAYNTDSKIIETIRTNGVLVVQPAPTGGRISGQSSVFKLTGWNWEDAIISADDGYYINWPAATETTGWWAEPGEDRSNEQYLSQVRELEEYLLKAKAYSQAKNLPYDVRLTGLSALFTRKKRLYIRAYRAREIRDAVLMCKRLGIDKPVISGGWEADVVAEILKEQNVPVILDRLTRLPDSRDAHVHSPFALPAVLDSLGVLFAFSYAGDMEAMGTRNLPFTAGMARGYGLKETSALAAISLNAAKIAGIDHLVGSLKPGKRAFLFVNKGDALEMITNNPSRIYIDGEEIRTTNFQTELYQLYLKKYNLDNP